MLPFPPFTPGTETGLHGLQQRLHNRVHLAFTDEEKSIIFSDWIETKCMNMHKDDGGPEVIG